MAEKDPTAPPNLRGATPAELDELRVSVKVAGRTTPRPTARPPISAMQALTHRGELDKLIDDGRATLESNPNAAYSGKITQVDKLARPRVRGVPVQYFGVTITLDKTDPRVMKPGTRVRAVLDVENRAKAFAIPRQAMFEKDGKKIVYRKHGSKYDAVPVEISSSTAGRVVVTKGIAEGDELALIDPAAKKDES